MQGTAGQVGTGVSGGILADLGGVTLTNSMLIGNDALAQFGYGGGLALLKSAATLTNSTVAANTAINSGAGIFALGSDLVVSGGRIIHNELSPGVSETVGLSQGAGILTAPDAGLNLAMTGSVTNVLISGNVGLPIAGRPPAVGPTAALGGRRI